MAPSYAIGVADAPPVTPEELAKLKAGAADGGKCPLKGGIYGPCSEELVATVRASDEPRSKVYYNVCSNHVGPYREAKWKTLEMYTIIPSPTTEGVEAKKQADRLAWLDDAYTGDLGHYGCCVVCSRGWNRGTGPKEDDIFPIDGIRRAPKLFHLKCLESVKAEYSNTWKVYNQWKETGELPSYATTEEVKP